MSEIIFSVVEDELDGGFVARALGHSIVTEAETWDELRRNVREAVLCHFDEAEAPSAHHIGGWPASSHHSAS